MSPNGKKRRKGKARQIDVKNESDSDIDMKREDSDSEGLGVAQRTYTRNASGKNQHPPAPEFDDVSHLIIKYHSENRKFRYKDYMKAFMDDHDITISRTRVADFLQRLGLSTTSRGNHMRDVDKRQIILDELANDPLQTRGPRVVKEALDLEGRKIGRRDVDKVMHEFHPEGFVKRHPRAPKKKIVRQALTSIGPDEEWSMDGHDKLNAAGFGIYGIRDKCTGRYLHYRVLPSNRYAAVVGVVFLECAKKRRGVCIQGSSDRGSETRDAYAFQTALREMFAPYLLPELIPSWQFLPSPRNITVESGWRPLFHTWGVNILEFYNAGLFNGFFEAGSPLHEQTSNWIWFPLIQRELDKFCLQQNNHRIRFQADKLLPSGGTPNEFYENPEKYGGRQCYIPVDEAVISHLLENCEEGYEKMRYVEVAFEPVADAAYEVIGKPTITLHTAWDVFRSMIEKM